MIVHVVVHDRGGVVGPRTWNEFVHLKSVLVSLFPNREPFPDILALTARPVVLRLSRRHYIDVAVVLELVVLIVDVRVVLAVL